MLNLRKYFVPMLFAAALCFTHLHIGTLAVDAVRYARIAATILERGEWFALYDGYTGAPYFNKPPLLFWLLAGLFKIFGFSTAVAKLPSACFAFGSLLLLFGVVSRRAGFAAGYLALVFLGVNRTFMRDLMDLSFDALAGFGALLCLRTALLQLEDRARVRAADWLWFAVGMLLLLQSKPPYAAFVLLPMAALGWQLGLVRPLLSARAFWVGISGPALVEIAWLGFSGSQYFTAAAGNQVGEPLMLRDGMLDNLLDWTKSVFISWAPLSLVAPFFLWTRAGEAARPDSRRLLEYWVLPALAIIFFVNCRPRYLLVPMLGLIVLVCDRLQPLLSPVWETFLRRTLAFAAVGMTFAFAVLHVPVHRENVTVAALIRQPEMLSPELPLCVDKGVEYRSARYARETRILAELQFGRQFDVFYPGSLPDSRKQPGRKLLAENSCLSSGSLPAFRVLAEFKGSKLIEF